MKMRNYDTVNLPNTIGGLQFRRTGSRKRKDSQRLYRMP